MEYIIIATVVFGIIGLLVWASISGGKLVKEREERFNRAESGKAKIIGFHAVGFRGQGKQGEFQAYQFSLEVSNAFKSPYKAETVWNVYPMGAPKVQEGLEVNVKIDAEDPSIIYPDIEAIEYSWSGALMLMARKM